ncbi:hypothetical protein AAC387_Pa10g0836 [Persea americana]
MKDDDPDTAMVCMIGVRLDRRSVRTIVRSSNPVEGTTSDNASKGHETPVTDEEAPLMNKNTGGMVSPVLWAIDDDVSLTVWNLESSFLPLTEPGKYSVFMDEETSVQ